MPEQSVSHAEVAKAQQFALSVFPPSFLRILPKPILQNGVLGVDFDFSFPLWKVQNNRSCGKVACRLHTLILILLYVSVLKKVLQSVCIGIQIHFCYNSSRTGLLFLNLEPCILSAQFKPLVIWFSEGLIAIL